MSLRQIGKGLLAQKHLQYTPGNETLRVEASRKDYYMIVLGTPDVRCVGGANDGKLIEGGRIKANQRVVVDFGTISPNHWHIDVVPNPKLYRLGVVNCSNRFEPNEGEQTLELFLHAAKEINLDELGADFQWLRLYALD